MGKEIPKVIKSRREGDPSSLVADPSLAQKELPWTPEHSSLEEIVSTALAWAKKQHQSS